MTQIREASLWQLREGGHGVQNSPKQNRSRAGWRDDCHWRELSLLHDHCAESLGPPGEREAYSLPTVSDVQTHKAGWEERMSGEGHWEIATGEKARVPVKECTGLGIIIETKSAWVWILPGPLSGYLMLDTSFDFSRLCCLCPQAANANRVIFTS